MDNSNRGELSKIFQSLSSKERIVALEAFSRGKISLTDVAKKAGMSRSGFQNVVKAFRDAGLIEQVGHRSYYSLSLKGKKVLDMLNELDRQITPLEKDFRREQLKASMAKFGSGLTENDIIELFEELEKETHK